MRVPGPHPLLRPTATGLRDLRARSALGPCRNGRARAPAVTNGSDEPQVIGPAAQAAGMMLAGDSDCGSEGHLVILLVTDWRAYERPREPYQLPTASPRWYVFRPMAHLALTTEEMRERLGFARRRKEELVALNGGDLAGADPHYRQQLVQEYFFHLVGAIEMLAQFVNEARNLGLDVEDASVSRVIQALRKGMGFGQRLRRCTRIRGEGGVFQATCTAMRASSTGSGTTGIR
jgi:hypothetical protein